MKKLFLLSLAVVTILLSSCDTVSFEKPVPVSNSEIKAFPQKMRGVYVAKTDTLRISENKFKFNDKENSLVIQGDLNKDNNVLKKFKKYYIVNIKDSVYWTAFATYLKKDTLFVYMPDISNYKKIHEQEKDNIYKELNEEFGIKELKKDGKTLLISNPNDKQLKEMFEKNIFIPVAKFVKITKK